MKRHEKIKTFIEKNAIQLLGILVVLANMWLATKLAPMAQDIELIKGRVYAIEIGESSFVHTEEFQQIVTRLDKISSRVDLLVGKLIK